MEVMIFFIFIAAVIGIGGILYSIIRRRRISELLSGLAQKYRLKFYKGSFMTFPSISGSIDSYPVQIEKYTFSSGKSSVQTLKFEIDIHQGKLYNFSITTEGFISHVKKFFGKDDILTGDASFDDTALIQGYNIPQLYTVLNKRARSLISYFINSSYRENFKIDQGAITYYMNLGNIQVLKDLELILDNIILLAKIFCRKGKPGDLLKENFLSETEKEVKKRLLTTLYSLKEFLPPDDPVIQKALMSRSVEIQYLGARLLKEKGYDQIKKLYKQGNVYIKRLIIKHLKNEKEACFVDYFLENAKNESSTAVKQELADYFKIIGNVKAEPFLRKELDTQRDYETISDFFTYKQTVIRALKYCGKYESIESLYTIKEYALKREADEAIAMIQDRIGTGDKGWLSMTSDTDDEGKLSLADNKEGDD